jgi:hypothetical protein
VEPLNLVVIVLVVVLLLLVAMSVRVVKHGLVFAKTSGQDEIRIGNRSPARLPPV